MNTITCTCGIFKFCNPNWSNETAMLGLWIPLLCLVVLISKNLTLINFVFPESSDVGRVLADLLSNSETTTKTG